MTYIEFLEKVLEKVEYETSEERTLFTCHMAERVASYTGEREHADHAIGYIRGFLLTKGERITYAGLLGHNGVSRFDPVVAHFQIYMLKRMIGEAKCKN